MQSLECDANIMSIRKEEGKTIIILDQTVFYPQGGGQPCDLGSIKNEDGVFLVEHVQYVDGVVEHVGEIEQGELSKGQKVNCRVDSKRRNINTRLHSAGHLVDLALKKLNIDWEPGKGFHFPSGPYVEYTGLLNSDKKEEVMKNIEDMCNQLIGENFVTTVSVDEDGEKNGKPLRTVYYGDFGIHCGGTHVSQLSEIEKIIIRKIKSKKEVIRISYSIG